MPQATDLLDLSGVTKRFGGLTAVDGVTFAVPEHTVHGMIGPNGAGKSTLVNMIAGAIRPTSGRIRFGSREIGRSPAHRRSAHGITRTFQEIRLFPEFTVLENVISGYHSRRRTGVPDALLGLPRGRRERREAIERAEEVIDFVGLSDFAGVVATDLPYGHRRMVEVARALAPRPELLLLDEPAAGMNVNERRSLVDLIARIRDGGLTVLVIEHHMDVIMTSCSRITVLSQGRKLSEGTPSEVQQDPEVLAAYLGPAVEPDEERAR
jgi:ABC-type branched-subunit amino acid transport system ATPase component